jgi:phospholipase/lecithinase/hemolysin
MRKFINAVFLLTAAFTLPVSAAKPQYEAFYVFGDSLSDTGNDLILTQLQKINPPIPPSESPHQTYYQGRFTNGPVAVEYLWRQLHGNASLAPFLSKPDRINGGISFAFGGSTSAHLTQTPGGFYVPGVLGQVELFRKALKGKKAKASALYAIWTGGNDYLLSVMDPTNVSRAEPQEVVTNITKAIQVLYSLGARNFLIPNLPDLGLTPMVQMNGGSVEFQALTQSHNALLAQALNQLAPRLRGIQIFHVDLFSLSQNLLQDEQQFTLTPPALESLAPGIGATMCFVVDPSSCPDVNVTAQLPLPFVFWDMMHPTTFIHKLYGDAMLERLNEQK